MSGRVQGVGYRFFVLTAARGLGLRGFVRNLRDGRVEVEAEGNVVAIEALGQALRRGPSLADVRDVVQEDLPAAGAYPPFSIRD